MILFHRRGKYKKLYQKLQSLATVKIYDGELSTDMLTDIKLFICFDMQSDEDCKVIQNYINGGGSVALFSTETESNLNDFLSAYGTQIEKGSVIRAVYHKGYTHPKHALIQNGVAIPFDNCADERKSNCIDRTSTSMKFVYPNGTTLSVESPSFPILSSGTTSYPVDCPIAAAWEATTGNGRLVVLGSAEIFADEWLEREDNTKLCDSICNFLLHQGLEFDPSLARSDFEEKECVPDIASLSNSIKPCLYEIEPLPQDYTTLLCDDQFGLTLDHIPKVIDLYKKLNVPYEPLTLIEPHFNCPHPPLRMATHAPRFPAFPPPQLELFDLDNCFTDVHTRLERLFDSCEEDSHSQLTHYIQEAGWILGVDSACRRDADEEEKAKHTLSLIAKVIMQSKMCPNENR